MAAAYEASAALSIPASLLVDFQSGLQCCAAGLTHSEGYTCHENGFLKLHTFIVLLLLYYKIYIDWMYYL